MLVMDQADVIPVVDLQCSPAACLPDRLRLSGSGAVDFGGHDLEQGAAAEHSWSHPCCMKAAVS